ncbi:glycoside hydrolase family protein [Natronospora cellulosivora (SeqCode)]
MFLVNFRVKVFLLIVLLFLFFLLPGCYNNDSIPDLEDDFFIGTSDVKIYPNTEKQVISYWGYDIKMLNVVSGLSASYAEELFLEDGFNVLRVPILAIPAHILGPGKIMESRKYEQDYNSTYDEINAAIKRVLAVRNDVKIFASLKLWGQETFPEWVKDNNNNVIPAKYAILLMDYLEFMDENNIPIHVLGIDNERRFNEGNITPYRFKEIVDELNKLAKDRGIELPKILGPADYHPRANWLSDFMENAWGDRLDIVATHYYPNWRDRDLDRFMNFTKIARDNNKPLWHAEVHGHWGQHNPPGRNFIDLAEGSLITIFDSIDQGFSGFVWWAYMRDESIRGQISRKIVQSTINSRPLEIEGFTDNPLVFGEFNTRAFRQDNDILIWVLNNRESQQEKYIFELANYLIAGPVTYIQWDTSYQTTKGKIDGSYNIFEVLIPERTITMIRIHDIYAN